MYKNSIVKVSINRKQNTKYFNTYHIFKYIFLIFFKKIFEAILPAREVVLLFIEIILSEDDLDVESVKQQILMIFILIKQK